MARVKQRSVLSGMMVKEAMQAHVIELPGKTPLKTLISDFIKYKTSTALVQAADASSEPGLVSRTDVMAAFYAGLPVETPIRDIMTGPPVTCMDSDSLEAAIEKMKSARIHQVYVTSETTGPVTGLLAWSDIMGLLYRYCRACARSGRRKRFIEKEALPPLRAKDVMTRELGSCDPSLELAGVIEILSEREIGALLVKDPNDRPSGIISKTDLILAFARGSTLDEKAGNIMNSPVTACLEDDLLSNAISQMLLFDIQRLFVENHKTITGVLSLSDAARLRSGTCRACGAGRVLES